MVRSEPSNRYRCPMISWPTLWRGTREAIPVYVPAIPFGLIIGLTVAETDVPDLAGFLTGALMFGGAAQLTAIGLLATGAGGLAALVGALVVNARHVMYSAALVPRFSTQPRWFRVLGPYFLIDQTFAMTSIRDEDSDLDWRSYYLGAGLLFWTAWQVTLAVGVIAGPALPTDFQFEFAIPAMFIGLVVPGLTRKPQVVAAVVGALTATTLWQMPNRGGLLIGAVVGAIAGYLAEGSSE